MLNKIKVLFVVCVLCLVMFFISEQIFHSKKDILNKKPPSEVVVFATYHKPAFLLKNDVVMPIHAGRAVEKDGMLSSADIRWMHKNMEGDNTGDNISNRNRRYSELSAVYWMYKNYMMRSDAPQYIGLIHYRRQLLLTSPQSSWQYKNPYYIVPTPSKNHLEEIGLTKENIMKILKDYDIIAHRVKIPHKVKDMFYPYRKDAYLKNGEILNYQKVMNIVLKHYPEMAEDVKTFGEEKRVVFANMFIMPKDAFRRYAEFMSVILDDIDNQLDYTHINPRLLGVWGEDLTSFYIHHLEKKGLRVKDSHAIFMDHSSEIAEMPTE